MFALNSDVNISWISSRPGRGERALFWGLYNTVYMYIKISCTTNFLQIKTFDLVLQSIVYPTLCCVNACAFVFSLNIQGLTGWCAIYSIVCYIYVNINVLVLICEMQKRW